MWLPVLPAAAATAVLAAVATAVLIKMSTALSTADAKGW